MMSISRRDFGSQAIGNVPVQPFSVPLLLCAQTARPVAGLLSALLTLEVYFQPDMRVGFFRHPTSCFRNQQTANFIGLFALLSRNMATAQPFSTHDRH